MAKNIIAESRPGPNNAELTRLRNVWDFLTDCYEQLDEAVFDYLQELDETPKVNLEVLNINEDFYARIKQAVVDRVTDLYIKSDQDKTSLSDEENKYLKKAQEFFPLSPDTKFNLDVPRATSIRKSVNHPVYEDSVASFSNLDI